MVVVDTPLNAGGSISKSVVEVIGFKPLVVYSISKGLDIVYLETSMVVLSRIVS